LKRDKNKLPTINKKVVSLPHRHPLGDFFKGLCKAMGIKEDSKLMPSFGRTTKPGEKKKQS
jgi:hypothetical protein